MRIIKSAKIFSLVFTDIMEWVGYAGIRDGITTSMPLRTADDAPLPSLRKLVELRYGIVLAYWGKGIAHEAAEVVMKWGVRVRTSEEIYR
jgi:RimJ/RimL family protein N-acetyltransferase